MLLIALAAALSMLVTDVIATCEVMAESRELGWLAGWLDVAGWIVSIACTSISVAVLTGHHPIIDKAYVIGFVSAANLFGTKLGQIIGTWFLHRDSKGKPATLEEEFTPEQREALMALFGTAARSGR